MEHVIITLTENKLLAMPETKLLETNPQAPFFKYNLPCYFYKTLNTDWFIYSMHNIIKDLISKRKNPDAPINIKVDFKENYIKNAKGKDELVDREVFLNQIQSIFKKISSNYSKINLSSNIDNNELKYQEIKPGGRAFILDLHNFVNISFYSKNNKTSLEFFKESMEYWKNNYDYIIIADEGQKLFRMDILETYKSGRPPRLPEITEQLELIKKYCTDNDIFIARQTHFEADDIIASTVNRFIKTGNAVDIFTADKDLMGLINDKNHIRVFNLLEKVFYNEQGFKNKYDFEPKYMATYLALCGDTADKIPGCANIGKMAATELIKTIGDLSEIMKEIVKVDDCRIPEKYRKHLLAGAAQIQVSNACVKNVSNLLDGTNLNRCKIKR